MFRPSDASELRLTMIGCAKHQLHRRHHHTLIATESPCRGAHSGLRPRRAHESMAHGLPSVSRIESAPLRFIPISSSKVYRHRFAHDRSLPESWKGAFDRVVSIEMLEAVG
jgi:hypothetical protein